ncbi:MAG: hypothetical protein ACI9DG_002474, partial [Oleispira sp.]
MGGTKGEEDLIAHFWCVILKKVNKCSKLVVNSINKIKSITNLALARRLLAWLALGR